MNYLNKNFIVLTECLCISVKMTLYFDTKAQFLDGDAVSTVCCWHLTQSLFAVASFNQNRGACVTIFDDSVRILIVIIHLK